ncbi:MAG TPA: phytochelatin synthase family protein [Anaeromyxobacteraceae bacterium]|nr:phytochelatin synthase family protein [Anaeromyxobacteraceae bacterium]
MNLAPLLLVLLTGAGQSAPGTVVPFASPESMVRLERSRHKVDFFALANQFEGQQNAAMCGPATAVIVLNALRAGNRAIAKPKDASLIPRELAANFPKGVDPLFARYTQATFFDDKFTAVKSQAVLFGAPGKDGKRDPGMQLRQLHEVLLRHHLDSRIRIVGEETDEMALKSEIVANLGSVGDYVVVNYLRSALGQKGGGHISPLGAYDESTDSFLVLDVNPNDGKTWTWVPAALLFAAMRTRDLVENRGFLLVREGVLR